MIEEKDGKINDYKKAIRESEEDFQEMVMESEKRTKEKIKTVTDQWRNENSDNPMIKGWDALTNPSATAGEKT